MTEFLSQWVLPIALVIPVSVGLFVFGQRLDPQRGPQPEHRTDPIPLDEGPSDTLGDSSAESKPPAPTRRSAPQGARRGEPTLY